MNSVLNLFRAPFACAAAMLLLGLGSGCTRVSSLNVPMEYRPTNALDTNAAAGRLPGPGTKVYVAPVEDKRPDRETIGKNIEKDAAVPVYAAGKTAPEFVHGILVEEMRSAGIEVVDDPSAASKIVDTELNRFFVEESNRYRGEVRAIVKVSDPAGQVLWRGPVAGNNNRFGRSLSAENYQETLSDSLRQMIAGLINNGGFLQALGGPQGGATGTPTR